MLESATPDLPDDVESLRALLVESRRENRQLRSTLIYRDAQIKKLLIQMARLKRMQFGAKSERLDREIEQLELLIEELQTPSVTPSRAPIDTLTEKAAPVRRPLPAHLPRESVVHAPAAACPSCGGPLRMIGEDVSKMLDYVPAHWKVIRHVRPKCACDACQQIVQAEAPSRPIPRGIAAPGLLAHVLVAKYCDSLPLHRQAEIYGRDGVEIERSTLADWVGGSAALLAPLVERLGEHVMSAAKLHADDTPVPVRSPGRGQTKTGRLWTHVRDDRPAGNERPPAVFFQYTPDRRGEHPRRHLQSFACTLQADGYAGFHHLFETGRIREAACWAHVRRKFFDIHQANQSPIAKAALDRITALYALEQDIRGKPPDIRKQHRQSRAGALHADMKEWLTATVGTLSAKSDLATTIHYATSRWPALTRYRDDGSLEIDNNIAERALRIVALGRKNYLFCGSDAGGERAAAIYSLIDTAKLNGLNPEAYLRDVITRIVDHPANRLDELLPWNHAEATR